MPNHYDRKIVYSVNATDQYYKTFLNLKWLVKSSFYKAILKDPAAQSLSIYSKLCESWHGKKIYDIGPESQFHLKLQKIFILSLSLQIFDGFEIPIQVQFSNFLKW